MRPGSRAIRIKDLKRCQTKPPEGGSPEKRMWPAARARPSGSPGPVQFCGLVPSGGGLAFFGTTVADQPTYLPIVHTQCRQRRSLHLSAGFTATATEVPLRQLTCPRQPRSRPFPNLSQCQDNLGPQAVHGSHDRTGMVRKHIITKNENRLDP